MENTNGVIKKLTSAERSYYTAAEVRETPKIYEKRLCYKKRSGGMAEKFSYYTKCRLRYEV